VYGGVCVCAHTCPTTAFESVGRFSQNFVYEQCAVLGNSRATFFNILRSAITIWCEAGAPLAFEVLRCSLVINFRKMYRKVCLRCMSEEKIDEVWSMY
jgi:hypothetical protein